MVFAEITDGVTTVYLVDVDSKLVDGELGGFEHSGQYYKPGLEKVTNFDFEGSPFVSLRSGSFEVDYSLISGLSGDELSCVIYLWDEYADTSRFKVFDGKIFKTDVIGVEQFKDAEFTKVRYRLRTDLTELSADLLATAPDLKQVDTDATTYNDGRVYPMTFGYVKYITPLALAVEVAAGGGGTWYSEKECTAMHDAGINVQYSQSGTTVTKTGVNPVYGITIDSRADSGANGSDISSLVPSLPSAVYRQASGSDPSSTNVMFVGDEWFKTDTGARVWWDGTAWTSVDPDYSSIAGTKPPGNADNTNANPQDYSWVTGTKPPADADNTATVSGAGGLIHVVANGSNSTATRLTTIGGTAPATELTTSKRLTFTATLDGQTHFYEWNDTTDAGWVEVANLGISAYDGDNVYIYAETTAADVVPVVGVVGDDTTAVRGTSTGDGNGVYGLSASGKGVLGVSVSGNGVRGSSTNSYGVFGGSTNSYGVYGSGLGTSGYGGYFTGGLGGLYATTYNDSGHAINALNTGSGYGVYAVSGNGESEAGGIAGYFYSSPSYVGETTQRDSGKALVVSNDSSTAFTFQATNAGGHAAGYFNNESSSNGTLATRNNSTSGPALRIVNGTSGSDHTEMLRAGGSGLESATGTSGTYYEVFRGRQGRVSTTSGSTISFGSAMGSTPVAVIATVESTTAESISVTNFTTTGFDVYFTGGGSKIINYIAIP